MEKITKSPISSETATNKKPPSASFADSSAVEYKGGKNVVGKVPYFFLNILVMLFR